MRQLIPQYKPKHLPKIGHRWSHWEDTKGTIPKSEFDEDRDKIKEAIKLGERLQNSLDA